MIVSLIVLLLLAFAYGGYRRTLDNQTASRDAGLPKSVTPATQAASEFMQATPAGTVPMTLRASRRAAVFPDHNKPACGADPKTGQPYRFNPQTGQPCDGFPRNALSCDSRTPREHSRLLRHATPRRRPKNAESQQRTSESRKQS